MNTVASASFSKTSYSSDSVWATLEQVYQSKENEATLSDVFNLLAYGRAGISSLEYLLNTCKYVSIVDDMLVVSLDVRVWPHDLGLEYTITSTEGVVETGIQTDITKSLDVIMNSEVERLPYVIEGTAAPQTPFIKNSGGLEDGAVLTVDGSLIRSTSDSFVVARVDGIATCYTHTITISQPLETIFSSTEKITLDDIVVTLAWSDSDGAQNEQITLDIPACVTQILEYCGLELRWMISVGAKGANNTVEIYVNSCDGKVLAIREKDNDGETK